MLTFPLRPVSDIILLTGNMFVVWSDVRLIYVTEDLLAVSFIVQTRWDVVLFLPVCLTPCHHCGEPTATGLQTQYP